MTSASSGPRSPMWRVTTWAKVLLPVGIVILMGLTVWRVVLTERGAPVHEYAGVTMGTTYAVKVDARLTAKQRKAIADTIEQRLSEVDGLMSTYDTTSELSRFNRHESTDPFVVSSLMLEVFATAREVSERSGGAFDVTVAPLVDAWGFGPPGRVAAAPSETHLSTLRSGVGYEKVQIDREAGTLVKTHPQTVADLSAVAKGYGVDRVSSALADLGIGSFLVEVGGEIKATGMKRDGTPWRVGIERPDTAMRAVYRGVDLIDEAVATSGDYRNFYEHHGVRYAHIIDPRTARPIPYAGASVTVVHASAAMADAWATALSVLGPDEGYDLAEREGVAALFVVRTDSGYSAHATPAFRQGGEPESSVREPV